MSIEGRVPNVFALWPAGLRWSADSAGHGAIDAVCLPYRWPISGNVAPPRPGLWPDAAIPSFFLCWTKESAASDTGAAAERDELTDYKFIYHILPMLRDPRYFRLGGRPILLVDRPEPMRGSARIAKLWREAAEQAGLSGLLLGMLCRDAVDPRGFGFDIAVACPLPGRSSFAFIPIIALGRADDPDRSRLVHALLGTLDRYRPAEMAVFIDCAGMDAKTASPESPAAADRAVLDMILDAKAEVARFLRGGAAGPDGGLTDWVSQIDYSLEHGRRPLVVVAHDAARAGAQILLLRLLAAMREKAPNIDPFIVLLSGGPLRAEFAALGVVLDVPQAEGTDTAREAYCRLIAARLLGRVAAPVLCNTVVSASFAAIAAEAGLATILYLHEMPASIAMYVGADRFREQVRRCRSIITVSTGARDALVRAFGEVESKIEVVRAGIRPGLAAASALELSPQDADYLRSLKIDPNRPIVLGCGALHPRKGADLFPLLADTVIGDPEGARDAQFVWCGGIQGEAEFAAWVDYDACARGLAKRVRFVGSVPDTGPFYRAASVFVLPSREDPFPLVALEAAATGVPVVAFEGSGGASELVEGLDELLVPYGDVAAMARRIAALLRDRKRGDALGQLLKRRVALLCPWDGYVEAMLARLGPPRS